MELFEYVAVTVSIVLALAITRVIDGLPHAFEPGRRYWVHASLLVANLLSIVMFWWAAWSYGDAAWTFPRFVLLLAAPVLLYSLAATLLPGDPKAVESWRDHFDRVYRRYFLLMALYSVVLAMLTSLLIGMPLDHPVRLFQLVVFTTAAIGTAWGNPKYHGAVAVIYLVILGVGGIGLFSEPRPLVQ